MLAGLTGAMVAALLVAWLIHSSRGVPYSTPNQTSPMPLSQPAPPLVADDRPETQPAPEPVKLPPYIELLEALTGSTPKIDAVLPSPNVIELTTAGVRRVRLLRSEWPQRVTTSIAVRIDGQGIEWTGRRDILELERRDNGDWVIVKQAASAPAADRP